MATQIKVVLKQDVENLGKGGDLVRVRPGFARNYLVPRGLAMVASSANVARIDELKRAAAAAAARELAAAKETAAKLATIAVKLERTVGDEGKMYGSVTARDIEEAYAAQGVQIDRKKLQLPEPLKALGAFEVPLKLAPEVIAVLRVEIVKKA